MRPIAENLEPTTSSSSAIHQLRAYFELIKPSVTRMVLVTTLCGSAIAPGKMDWAKAGLALLGTAMVVGSANALNMVLERDTDALMVRTAMRPLPSGRLGARAATVFGVVLAVAGTLLLWFEVGTVAAWLAAIAHVIYVLVYTPLKRMTPLALHVGGVPGALPPVIGWASMTGHTEPGAWALFAILFMWQLPHFLAISIFRKDEYGRANICVFPNAEGIRAHQTSTLHLQRGASRNDALALSNGARRRILPRRRDGTRVGVRCLERARVLDQIRIQVGQDCFLRIVAVPRVSLWCARDRCGLTKREPPNATA
ncbi:MAG: heme o synthase [Polyangiaceae bacterium]